MGGGCTGMWAAYHLKQLDPGTDVVILEQDICGGGPSGRSGGFLNSFWNDLDELASAHGDDRALRICRTGEESVDAWFRKDGDINAAASDAQVGAWAHLVITADRLGLGDQFQVLTPEELRAKVDSPTFRGGVFSPLAATVQPAALARGLRRVLLEMGVRIFEGTPVTRFGAGSPSLAETPGGTVKAGAAVLALNAWAAHWKRLRRAITVRGSYIVLTAPAPDKLADIGWTNGTGVSDYRAALHFLRTTPDGRIAFGIGGMQPNPARAIGPRFAYDEAALRVAARDLHRMFPTFADVPIEAWLGRADRCLGHASAFLRGVHHQELLRELGLLPINRVAAAEKGARMPRRREGRRVAKSLHVEDKTVQGSDGREVSISLYAQDGAIGIGALTDRGEMLFEPLRRFRTHRTRDKSGGYRWYNDYRLPQRMGGGIVTVRLHTNDDDRTRRFNRTENVRPIPPSDPDFAHLYARRNDAESINRSLEDTLFLGRAHSLGRLRQQVDFIGYALLVNGLTLLRHERRGRLPAAA